MKPMDFGVFFFFTLGVTELLLLPYQENKEYENHEADEERKNPVEKREKCMQRSEKKCW